MKWLITGGCGFIGRALASELLSMEGQRVRVLDNLCVGTKADLRTVSAFSELPVNKPEPTWKAPLALCQANILDYEAVASALIGADVVIHLAANTGVGPSVEDPFADCQANVTGTLNMLEACRHAGVDRLVFASSGAPLGVQTPPLREDMAPHPASPYGASKLAGEGYCSAYHHCFGVETVVLRFGNVYGEGSGHKQSVVAKFIKQALAGERLEIFGDGSQTRDFIHIADLVRAIRQAAEQPHVGGETFQIATAQETTVTEMTDALVAVMQADGLNPPEVFNGASRAGDVARNYSDTAKAAERLDWRAEVGLQDGLRRTLRYFLNQKNQ
ncbi:NAD-dependent epimerase/dehydratase family protein [Spiribacter roseus]|uniref:NAD-dependent epimerase/dehydratase family protein n=1 Tax=Spiribacter roseus TaxID=1855875 RepID=UPI001330849D|nr:NAD-dependent epimerase/dehydratase family protein [Spiribacter roseus]KAF0281734.1 epimerase [Spiribacter roseus]